MKLYDIFGEDLAFGKSGKTKIKEMLPAKAAAELYRWKNQQQQPVAPATPSIKPQPVQTHKPLAQLQGERAKLNQLIQLKAQIEKLTARAERTRMGIPPGLAADLEVDYTPQSDQDYNDLINLYQRQIKQLTDYITRQRLVYRESAVKENKNNAFIKKYTPWVADQLKLKQLPKIELLDEPMNPSFGTFDADNDTLYLVTAGRHPVDVLRTMAHELVHYKQRLEGRITPESGATGSEEENEANATAGVIMRGFNQAHPNFLQTDK